MSAVPLLQYCIAFILVPIEYWYTFPDITHNDMVYMVKHEKQNLCNTKLTYDRGVLDIHVCANLFTGLLR